MLMKIYRKILVSFGLFKILIFRTWQWWKLKKSISQLPSHLSSFYFFTTKIKISQFPINLATVSAQMFWPVASTPRDKLVPSVRHPPMPTMTPTGDMHRPPSFDVRQQTTSVQKLKSNSFSERKNRSKIFISLGVVSSAKGQLLHKNAGKVWISVLLGSIGTACHSVLRSKMA